MAKVHRFEPRLTKKKAKIGFKVTKKGLKPFFGIKPMLSIWGLNLTCLRKIGTNL